MLSLGGEVEFCPVVLGRLPVLRAGPGDTICPPS